METLDVAIRGGSVVTETGQQHVDLGIREGRIAAIGKDLPAARKTVDAGGLLVLPGAIDSHVHVDQAFSSGAEIADTFETGTASALAGGTTTIISFVIQPRGGSLTQAVEAYHDKAKQARCDYTFHLTITDPTPEMVETELPALVSAGHRSFKIFMTNESTRLDDRQILIVLAAARTLGALVCVHAEHHQLIGWLTERLIASGCTAPKNLALAKPPVVEREAVQRIIALAEALDAPIQIFHVSGAESADEIARAQARGLKVWAETCTQYLALDKHDLDRPGMEGAKYMFSPAPRTPADQDALWRRIKDGTIGIVSSDHSPLRYDDPKGKLFAGANAPFDKIPNGVPGLAARLPVLFSEGVAGGRIDVETFVRLVATEPARLFGLYPRKGVLRVGSDADVVLWDPTARRTLTNAMMHHGSDYTPYEGRAIEGAAVAVYLAGRLAFDGKVVLAEPGSGQFLARRPYDAIQPTGRFAVGFNPYAPAS